MPPRPLADGTVLKRLVGVADSYVCPSCRFQQSFIRRNAATQTRAVHAGRQKRETRPDRQIWARSTNTIRKPAQRPYTNGLASRTAINAPSAVPPAYRDLQQRLSALQHEASSYTDLSRLQLALRSLESENPTIRIAFLGLGANGLQAARKLARALLSDVLGQEELWERELLSTNDSEQALLLRYGDAEDFVQQGNSVTKEIPIPSRFLQNHRLEILITPLNANTDGNGSDGALRDALLAPPLTTPTSAGGRVGFVRYPVHKALVVAEGISGAVEYGRLPQTVVNDKLVSAALSIPLRGVPGAVSSEASVADNAVDADLANHAIDLFRASNANGAVFSDEWQASRVTFITEWLADVSKLSATGISPFVADTISSILSAASSTVSAAEKAATMSTNTVTVPENNRARMQEVIATWSSDAHRDLQLNLTSAFSSSAWRRTAWWRLLWRIDDISAYTSSILQHSYLHEAECALANVCGRIEEAGLASAAQLKETSSDDPTSITVKSLLPKGMQEEMQSLDTGKAEDTVAELMQMPTMLSRVQQESGLNAIVDPPWPQTINLSRQQMLHILVPTLHRKAQAYLLQTLTTVGGSAALGGWLWVATGGLAIYEAGAIFSLGLVWALRRLQKKWGVDREGFADTVRENGRGVLAEVEGQLRKAVQDGGREIVMSADAKNWEVAKAALRECRDALDEVR